jgi:hypothetical protein
MQMTTVEARTNVLKVIGYTAVALFGRSVDGSQPSNRKVLDFAINRGGFQLPLWPVQPPLSGSLNAASMHDMPHLPCASLLVRVMSVTEAKAGRCGTTVPLTLTFIHLSCSL